MHFCRCAALVSVKFSIWSYAVDAKYPIKMSSDFGNPLRKFKLVFLGEQSGRCCFTAFLLCPMTPVINSDRCCSCQVCNFLNRVYWFHSGQDLANNKVHVWQFWQHLSGKNSKYFFGNFLLAGSPVNITMYMYVRFFNSFCRVWKHFCYLNYVNEVMLKQCYQNIFYRLLSFLVHWGFRWPSC